MRKSSIWLYPWILAVAISPLLYGGVGIKAKSLFGILIGISFLASARQISSSSSSRLRGALIAAILFVLIFPLVPLPARAVQILSPSRALLSRDFPLELGKTQQWFTLSLSPGRTIERLYYFALLGASFLLARHVAQERKGFRAFVLTLASGFILLLATQVWFLWDGHGIWSILKHHPAGTFANRNHFSDWLIVSAMFFFGVALTFRNRPKDGDIHITKSSAIGLAALALTGIAFALATGSRGALAALLSGSVAWILLVSRKQRHGALIGAGLLAVITLVALSSGQIFYRLATESSDFKFQIWRDTLGLWKEFPVFGIGWGSFEVAFNHFKTFHGSGLFLHAENDYLEFLVEGGLCAALMVVIAFVGRLRNRSVASTHFEITIGALAGCAAFLGHAVFEFVLENPATGLLFASMAGFATGFGGKIIENDRPRLAANYMLAAAILVFGIVQGLFALQWENGIRKGSTAELRKVARSWPLNSKWTIGYLRAMLSQSSFLPSPEAIAALREQLQRTLQWDPYNWEVRLERAWLDLNYGDDLQLAIAEAEQVARLNSLQPEIPLQFAPVIGKRSPDRAIDLLKLTPLDEPGTLSRILEIAWQIKPDPAILWQLTPTTPQYLLELGDFAKAKKLRALGLRAYDKSGPVPGDLKMAKRYLELGEPDRALQIVGGSPKNDQENFLIFNCLVKKGMIPDALEAGEKLALKRQGPEKNPQLWAKYQQDLEKQRYEQALAALADLLNRLDLLH